MTNLPEWALPIRDEMARAICRQPGSLCAGFCHSRNCRQAIEIHSADATAALTVALPLIAEHMAGVADDHYLSTPDDDHQLGQADCASNIAAAIRQEATPRKP